MEERVKKIIKIIAVIVFLIIFAVAITPYVYHTSSYRYSTVDSSDDDLDNFEIKDVENSAPKAKITCNIRSGKIPLTVNFEGAGADSDGKIISYHWDFDDGQTSNQQNPSHVFEEDGRYDVVLTVTDDYGGTGKDTVQIVADINTPPTADASYHFHRMYWNKTAPVVIYFRGGGTDVDGEIVSYHWEFGPRYYPIYPYWGQYMWYEDSPSILFGDYESDEQDPVRIIYKPGTYWAKLTVTDDDGATSTDKVYFYVWSLSMTIKETLKETFKK